MVMSVPAAPNSESSLPASRSSAPEQPHFTPKPGLPSTVLHNLTHSTGLTVARLRLATANRSAVNSVLLPMFFLGRFRGGSWAKSKLNPQT